MPDYVRYSSGIKPQIYKALSKFQAVIFPEKAPREHWIFLSTALFPYRFFSLSPTKHPGTVTVRFQNRNNAVIEL